MRLAQVLFHGIIPAYAGSTHGGASRPLGDIGSSPRMRGAPTTTRCRRESTKDHPRVCGEHIDTGTEAYYFPGSSPRMRGALRRQHVQVEPVGIIPAYAGSTPCSPGTAGAARDHPRVCGEHRLGCVPAAPPTGSSPRMRGAHVHVCMHLAGAGIIPAYAGSTVWSATRRSSAWDHPRVCGEHCGELTLVERVLGSSPRMRGALSSAGSVAVVAGIIPAYAGSTAWRLHVLRQRWDHPRVCGEHWTVDLGDVPAIGSSPRMRGALQPCCKRQGWDGIIPAYAGSTLLILMG